MAPKFAVQVGPLVVGAVAVAVFVAVNWTAFEALGAGIAARPNIWASITAAALTQLLGHVFRVLRSKLLVDEVNRGSFRGHFAALCAGFLYNAVIPLRLGEVLRALIIARALRVSFLYTIVAVIVERLIDVVFLAIIVLGIGFLIAGSSAVPLLIPGLLALLGALLLLAVFVLLVREQKFALSFVASVSGLFTPRIRNRIRFRIWSTIYGYQRVLRQRSRVSSYLLLALASWVCYIGSMWILVGTLIGNIGFGPEFVSASAPYLTTTSVVVPNNFDNFATILAAVMNSSVSTGSTSELFVVLSWGLLVIPVSLLGLGALCFVRLGDGARIDAVSQAGLTNKLRNFEDVSQEFPDFLDAYFHGHGLGQILHRIEVKGELALVNFFRGGSNAVIALAVSGDQLFVKKVVPSDDSDPLRRQKEWLERYQHAPGVVRLLREDVTPTYYALDLEFRPTAVSFFEHVHRYPADLSEAQLDACWEQMQSTVYGPAQLGLHEIERDEYVESRIVRRVKTAIAADSSLARAADGELIRVNGKTLINLLPAIERIRNHPKAWRDLATYSASPCHGDFTVDNLLMDENTGNVILIDPSDDNQIRGAVVDVGRMRQSLHFGYEFMLNDSSPVEVGSREGVPTIDFAEVTSHRYFELEQHFLRTVEARLVPEELRATLFHASAFLGRMLTHRLAIQPATAVRYYAQSVRGLNEFLALYETADVMASE